MCRTIRSRGKIDPIFVDASNKLPSALASLLEDNDLVLTQGAGDVGRVAKNLEQLKLNINQMKVISE